MSKLIGVRPIWTALIQIIGHLSVITNPYSVSYRKRLVFYTHSSGQGQIWMAIGAETAKFIRRLLMLSEVVGFKYVIGNERQNKQGAPYFYYTISEDGVSYMPGQNFYLQRVQADALSKPYYSIGGNRNEIIKFLTAVRSHCDVALVELQKKQAEKRRNKNNQNQRRHSNG